MTGLTLIVGVLLVLLGVVGYIATGAASVTALIPAFFGIAYIILGLIARRGPGPRKHAMHITAILSLLGIIANVTALLALPALISGSEEVARPAAVITRSLMALICTVHLIAAVRSFVVARLIPAT